MLDPVQEIALKHNGNATNVKAYLSTRFEFVHPDNPNNDMDYERSHWIAWTEQQTDLMPVSVGWLYDQTEQKWYEYSSRYRFRSVYNGKFNLKLQLKCGSEWIKNSVQYVRAVITTEEKAPNQLNDTISGVWSIPCDVNGTTITEISGNQFLYFFFDNVTIFENQIYYIYFLQIPNGNTNNDYYGFHSTSGFTLTTEKINNQTTRIYANNDWQQAIPHIYINNKWEQTIPWVFFQGEWHNNIPKYTVTIQSSQDRYGEASITINDKSYITENTEIKVAEGSIISCSVRGVLSTGAYDSGTGRIFINDKEVVTAYGCTKTYDYIVESNVTIRLETNENGFAPNEGIITITEY